jgi:hypothetical protein
MRDIPRLLIVAPNADIGAITAATGFEITTAVYVETDTARPRAQYGAVAGTPYTADQKATIDGFKAGNTYPNSTFTYYNYGDPAERNTLTNTLTDLGLTTSNGSI